MTLPDFDPLPVYVILGASGGIGSALTRRLAACGSRLVLAARASDRLNELAHSVNSFAVPTDAMRFDAVEQLFTRAMELHGRVDGAACCVGSILLKAAHLTSEAEFLQTINANLTAAFATVRAAAKVMGDKGGSIVLCSSAAARIGLPNHEAVAAAKAGIIGLTLSAAATYAPKNVRVNAVAPGLVRTPLTSRITGSEPALKASLSMHPLGRIGEPSDVASAIEWLLSPTQTWVTGQVIGIDGGLADLKGMR
ncbi:MAG: SDR family oxidoreductase [Planctomycetes bacterium]|nr:SDR family oxidoreductase [Planctomycetota bacterium]